MIFRPKKDASPLYKCTQLVVVIALIVVALLIGRVQLKKHFEKPIVPSSQGE